MKPVIKKIKINPLFLLVIIILLFLIGMVVRQGLTIFAAPPLAPVSVARASEKITDINDLITFYEKMLAETGKKKGEVVNVITALEEQKGKERGPTFRALRDIIPKWSAILAELEARENTLKSQLAELRKEDKFAPSQERIKIFAEFFRESLKRVDGELESIIQRIADAGWPFANIDRSDEDALQDLRDRFGAGPGDIAEARKRKLCAPDKIGRSREFIKKQGELLGPVAMSGVKPSVPPTEPEPEPTEPAKLPKEPAPEKLPAKPKLQQRPATKENWFLIF